MHKPKRFAEFCIRSGACGTAVALPICEGFRTPAAATRTQASSLWVLLPPSLCGLSASIGLLDSKLIAQDFVSTPWEMFEVSSAGLGKVPPRGRGPLQCYATSAAGSMAAREHGNCASNHPSAKSTPRAVLNPRTSV